MSFDEILDISELVFLYNFKIRQKSELSHFATEIHGVKLPRY